MARIDRDFNLAKLDGNPKRKTALLVNPPVYDTQFWAEWSQPYGLLRIARLLRNRTYKKVWFYDFLETDEDRTVSYHRINPAESYGELHRPTGACRPLTIAKDGQQIDLFIRHYGRSWEEFEEWLRRRGLLKNVPDEVWVTSVMSYWWESTRDLITRVRRLFGPKCKIILGGIYPSLAAEHARTFCKPDIVVAGEVKEANDLWPDLAIYRDRPTYSIITPARGCPYDCSYCAQKTINSGVTKVRFRPVDDIVREMRYAFDRFGIRDFAFYADFLLFDFKNNLMPLLRELVRQKLPFRLFAPEGLDTRFLSQSQELVDLLKSAHFQKIYLPVESIDDEYVKTLNRRHVKLHHFVAAAKMCERAGFQLRNLDVNAFVLYGLPGETIDRVVKTALFVSEIVGSIIPMLFSPVPSTALFEAHRAYFEGRGVINRLEMLNGKYLPFVHMNEGSVHDYVDLQRLMFMLNAQYRSASFKIFGASGVSAAFLHNLRNGFEAFVRLYSQTDSARETIDTLRVLN